MLFKWNKLQKVVRKELQRAKNNKILFEVAKINENTMFFAYNRRCLDPVE